MIKVRWPLVETIAATEYLSKPILSGMPGQKVRPKKYKINYFLWTVVSVGFHTLINKGPSILLSICSDICPNIFIPRHRDFLVSYVAAKIMFNFTFHWKCLVLNHGRPGVTDQSWTKTKFLSSNQVISVPLKLYFSRIFQNAISLTLILCWGRLCRCRLWRSFLN